MWQQVLMKFLSISTRQQILNRTNSWTWAKICKQSLKLNKHSWLLGIEGISVGSVTINDKIFVFGFPDLQWRIQIMFKLLHSNSKTIFFYLQFYYPSINHFSHKLNKFKFFQSFKVKVIKKIKRIKFLVKYSNHKNIFWEIDN